MPKHREIKIMVIIMKKLSLLLFVVLQIILLTACTASDEGDMADFSQSSLSDQTAQTATQAETTEPVTGETTGSTTSERESDMLISVSDSHSNEVVFELNDSTAASELYSQLPLSVEVDDFSNNEKIFYPEALEVSGTPVAEGGAGTLAYYAPWGDVVMFYGDYQVNNSLYELGNAVSGTENIGNLSGTLEIDKYTP